MRSFFFSFLNIYTNNVSFIKAWLHRNAWPVMGKQFFVLYLSGQGRSSVISAITVSPAEEASPWVQLTQICLNPADVWKQKGQFFLSEGRRPVSCSVTKRRLDWNRFWHCAALALLSRLGDQLRLTLTRASLLSPDPTWHTSFTDASENEPIQAIYSTAAVPAGLISSPDVTNAVNWSIGVRWRFVLASRPSSTAVGVPIEFSCCKREGGGG